MTWLSPGELRVGLGCMRLSTEREGPAGGGEAPRDHREGEDGREARGQAVIAAALSAGVTVFDTARAYGLDDGELGHNERLLARALGPDRRARVVTKGGMRRPAGRWLPDGRAGALRADCEASLAALGGRPIDLYLLHAPDPRVPWATSVRALGALFDEGLVRAVGLCNVSRAQLDEALALAPIAAVQVGLSLVDDGPLRAGVVARCRERGIALLCHSPLGGPRRARALLRRGEVREAAARAGITPAQAALAALLALGEPLAAGEGAGEAGSTPALAPQEEAALPLEVIVLPGARRVEAVREVAAAASARLTAGDLSSLRGREQAPRAAGPPVGSEPGAAGDEVVLIMGLQGAGKSERARDLEARGYLRLCRDEEGGTLRGLAGLLERALAEGRRRVVIDGTLLTRAARREFLAAAARAAVPVRGLWLDTPAAEAQVNVVGRMLAAHGRLLAPEELRRGRYPTAIGPTVLFRALRELEAPTLDEGWTALEVLPFARRAAGGRAGRLVLIDALLDDEGGLRGDAEEVLRPAGVAQEPCLVFGWRPDGGPAAAAPIEGLIAAGASEVALCEHPAGPPVCWCRPPLPGLVLAFAARHRLDPAASVLVGEGAAVRTLAATLGARLVPPR